MYIIDDLIYSYSTIQQFIYSTLAIAIVFISYRCEEGLLRFEKQGLTPEYSYKHGDIETEVITLEKIIV